MPGTETLTRTRVHDRHVAARARLVSFSGWKMPVQYAGIREEHRAGFVGAEIVRAAREQGTFETLVPFALTGPGIARQGDPMLGRGVVTSGTPSPMFGIGTACLPADHAAHGTAFEVDMRGRTRPAEVRTSP